MSLPLRPRPVRRGFTLIEVLLTSVLAATLLAALWALLSMYLKMFDAGQAKVEQSQLVRTLFAQLETDLASVVQSPPVMPPIPLLAPPASPSGSPPPPAGNSSPSPASSAGQSPPPAASSPGAGASPAQAALSMGSGTAPSAIPAALRQGRAAGPQQQSAPRADAPAAQRPASSVTTSASLRPAGVFGTETSLQIDVAQAVVAPPELEFDQRRPPGELGPSRAPELITIVYAFEENQEPGQPLGQATMRLVRREMTWEDSHPAQRGARASSVRMPLGSSPQSSDGAMSQELAAEPLPPPVEGDQTTIIPEVAQFGIRYFDGTLWSLDWNSAERKALPVAIEIALELRPLHEPVVHQTAEAPGGDVAQQLPTMPVHRLLVHLPAAEIATPHGAGQRGLPGRGRDAEPPLKGNPYGARR